MKPYVRITAILLLFGLPDIAYPQTIISGQDTTSRTIKTAFPFLYIAPDAKSTGLGQTGIASISNLAPIHWNIASISHLTETYSASYSGGPWLSRIINDISLKYFTIGYKVNPKHAFAGSFRYFDLGEIFQANSPIIVFKQREYALDLGYSHQFSRSLAMGVAVRYFQSNIKGNFSTSTIRKRITKGLALDIGFLYTSELEIFNKSTAIGIGMNISNLGPGVEYVDEDFKDPIPTNLGIGFSASYPLGSKAELTVNLDFNKLLVPSRPVYKIDQATGALVVDANGKAVIERGKDPDRGFLAGITGSFSDAPNGLKEELQEITTGFGLGLLLKEKYAIRTGLFNENELKGNRKFMTIGAGYKFKPLSLDVSYLIPYEKNHLLSETFRFSISFMIS